MSDSDAMLITLPSGAELDIGSHCCRRAGFAVSDSGGGLLIMSTAVILELDLVVGSGELANGSGEER